MAGDSLAIDTLVAISDCVFTCELSYGGVKCEMMKIHT
jgi:hypothetical protein